MGDHAVCFDSCGFLFSFLCLFSTLLLHLDIVIIISGLLLSVFCFVFPGFASRLSPL